MEFDLKQARPDIALVDGQGNVIAVIEIVVTHKPEENVLAFYRANNIILIMIELAKEDDLNHVFNEVLSISRIEFCPNPKCPKCNHYMLPKQLFIITGPCSRCRKSMNIAISHIVGTRDYDGPDGFSKEELFIARNHGALIKKQYSRTRKEIYEANTCLHCNAFAGQFFLIQDYVLLGLDGQYPLRIIHDGWGCTNCVP
ncbi:hypothetical protein [Brevibacillus formosus]|uniref:hypothetical protein n=1 Tax=Brevibacillus formosus TaxID=54913 RepID=UPI003F1C463D